MRFAAIINPEASTLKTADKDGLEALLEDRFGAHGHKVDITFATGSRIGDALDAAVRDKDVEGVLVGGGDGTISAAAGTLQGTGKALAILPGGNMNLFARSLGIPLDFDQAVAALAAGHPAPADIGFANERPFIHEFSLGLHPEMIEARDREKFGTRIGKLIASLRSLGRVILRPPRVRVRLDDGSGRERKFATPVLAVSNNPYGDGHLPYADRVDGGVLGVYITHTARPADLAALAARLSTGTWSDMPQVEAFTACELTLKRRGRMKAAIDGELVRMRGPVHVRIAPGALSVIVPRDEDAVRGQ